MTESKFPFSRAEIIKTVTEETSKMRTGGVYATYSRLSRFDENDPGYSVEIQPDRQRNLPVQKMHLRFGSTRILGGRVRTVRDLNCNE